MVLSDYVTSECMVLSDHVTSECMVLSYMRCLWCGGQGLVTWPIGAKLSRADFKSTVRDLHLLL